MKSRIMQCFSASYHLIFYISKYAPKHTGLRHPELQSTWLSIYAHIVTDICSFLDRLSQEELLKQEMVFFNLEMLPCEVRVSV
jgi:hypothetical protein